MINLGDKVKDTITGFIGIAVSRTAYLQGCDRVGVQAPVKKNAKPEDPQFFDEPQLITIKKKVAKQGNRRVGGYKPDVPSRM